MKNLLSRLFGLGISPEFHTMTFVQSGGGQVRWDANNEKSVSEAKKVFEEATANGANIALKADESGNSTGDKIREFDPRTDTLIVKPVVAG
jgi:hypothetical protein